MRFDGESLWSRFRTLQGPFTQSGNIEIKSDQPCFQAQLSAHEPPREHLTISERSTTFWSQSPKRQTSKNVSFKTLNKNSKQSKPWRMGQCIKLKVRHEQFKQWTSQTLWICETSVESLKLVGWSAATVVWTLSSVSLCYFRLMMLRSGLCWAAPSVLVAVRVHYEHIWDGSNAFLMAVLKDKTLNIRRLSAHCSTCNSRKLSRRYHSYADDAQLSMFN